MKIPRNLPVKTRLPFKLWVLAGIITAFSMMQVATQTQPDFRSHQASATHVIAAQDNICAAWWRSL
jgi:hypothetical protein